MRNLSLLALLAGTLAGTLGCDEEAETPKPVEVQVNLRNCLNADEADGLSDCKQRVVNMTRDANSGEQKPDFCVVLTARVPVRNAGDAGAGNFRNGDSGAIPYRIDENGQPQALGGTQPGVLSNQRVVASIFLLAPTQSSCNIEGLELSALTPCNEAQAWCLGKMSQELILDADERAVIDFPRCAWESVQQNLFGDPVCGDGLDNDCSGEADDNTECPMQPDMDVDAGPPADMGVDGGIDMGADGGEPECETGNGPQDCETGLFGLCAQGERSCLRDPDTGQLYWSECQPRNRPLQENCNDIDQLDEDCDGFANEQDGDSCACEQTNPPTEICDGLDNDCDGVVDCGDDIIGCNIQGVGQCNTGQAGICAAGRRVCLDGGFTCEQMVFPAGEDICNGLDDDCDGTEDEDAEAQPCYEGPAGTEGEGICRGGTTTCEQGDYGVCVGQVLPGVEICDQVDNDCNGVVDDVPGGCDCVGNEERDCYSGPAGTEGQGVCTSGRQRCEGGSWGACQGETLPSGEVCDGQDNDCNGIDDDVNGTGQPCTRGQGECFAEGIRACNGMVLGCTAQPGEPQPETCNERDDDCDGDTDEEFPDLNSPCQAGVGACLSRGMRVCAENGRGTECTARAGEGRVEACNGQDDDCDNEIDETFQVGQNCTAGVGICARQGQFACDPEGSQVCSAQAGPPAMERCNGEDDDCNEQVDDVDGLGDGCEDGVGACRAIGELVCNIELEELVCNAQAGEPSEELCNGIDDDCDGIPDDRDGDIATVGDACADGQGICEEQGELYCDPDAGEILCTAQAAGGDAELCNGIDDDCDGMVDEGLGLNAPCSAGVGACADDGVTVCNEDGEPVCDAIPGPPGLERCNGQDDNCDGNVDNVNGVGEVCAVGVGACRRAGTRICGDGELVCDATPDEPQAETCNGIDDDCDGSVDEDATGVGNPCQEGIGACRQNGQVVCDDGALRCNAQPGAPINEDIAPCNGVDDDCDGEVDEGQECIGLPCNCNDDPRVPGEVQEDGTCQPFISILDSCDGPPKGEGIDNDCDGEVDEDVNSCACPNVGLEVNCYTGPEGTANVGQCRAGRRRCQENNIFSACGEGDLANEVFPIPEVPDDDLDNDCDGVTDEVP